MENNFDYQGAKNAGYSDSEIQGFLSSKQPQQPQAQQPNNGGNLLTNLLPLIGGTVGSIGGSVLDPLLGPLGTIGGGAAGAGFGQTIADLLQKKQPTLQDVGGQAAAGGIGGVAGKALEPLLGMAGRIFSKGIPDTLDKAGSGFVNSQFNVPRAMSDAMDLKGTMKALERYGVSNIDNIPQAFNKVSGATGGISTITRNIIAKAPPVDTVGIRKMAQDLISTNPTTGDDKIMNFINKQLSNMNGGAQGSLEVNAHPLDVLQVMRNLEGKAAEMNNLKPMQKTIETISTGKIYTELAQELEDRLYLGLDSEGNQLGHGGADQILLKNQITPDSPEYQKLAEVSPVLANDATTQKTVGGVRSLAAPFVRANKLANETFNGEQIGFNNVGGAAKGLGKIAQNPLNLLAMPLGSNTVNAGVGSGMQKAASAIRGIPMPGNIASLLSKVTGQGIGQSVAANATDPTTSDASSSIPSPSSMPTQIATDANAGDSQQQAVKALLGSVMLSHAKNANDLIAAYNFLNPQNKESETARVNLQKANGIQSLIQKMQGDVAQAKYLGPFGSLIQKTEQKTGFGGGGDPATTRLNQNMKLLQQAIATEVHRRGMSEQSLKAMYDAFPQSDESHATYVQKLNNLQDMMQTWFGGGG